MSQLYSAIMTHLTQFLLIISDLCGGEDKRYMSNASETSIDEITKNRQPFKNYSHRPVDVAAFIRFIKEMKIELFVKLAQVFDAKRKSMRVL